MFNMEEIKRMTEISKRKIKKLEAEIEKNRPKVELANLYNEYYDDVDIEVFVTILNDRNIKISEKKLLAWMRNNNFIEENKFPKEEEIELGYFKVNDVKYNTVLCKLCMQEALLTPMGQHHYYELLKNDFKCK